MLEKRSCPKLDEAEGIDTVFTSSAAEEYVLRISFEHLNDLHVKESTLLRWHLSLCADDESIARWPPLREIVHTENMSGDSKVLQRRAIA